MTPGALWAIPFGLANLVIALWCGTKRRGADRWAGPLLLAIWLTIGLADIIFGREVGRYVAGVTDMAAAIICTFMWIGTSKCWPLILMGLYMVQITDYLAWSQADFVLHLNQAGPVAVWRNLHRMEVVRDVLNIMQMATVLGGPYLHVPVGVLHDLLVGFRPWRRLSAHVQGRP